MKKKSVSSANYKKYKLQFIIIAHKMLRRGWMDGWMNE
jgi:hypothetical protein